MKCKYPQKSASFSRRTYQPLTTRRKEAQMKNIHLRADPRALVLVDLDGTVIDDRGKCSPEIPLAFSTAARHGIMMGWATSTSDFGIRRWERILGIDHDIMQVRVVEDGAVITGPNGWFARNVDQYRSTQYTSPTVRRWIYRFMMLRRGVQLFCMSKGFRYVEDHPSTWIQTHAILSPKHQAIVCADRTRLFSFTCEVRRIAQDNRFGRVAGMLEISPWLTKECVAGEIVNLARFLRIPTHRLDAGDWYIDLPHPTATKGEALRRLRDLLHHNVPIIMIGNGSNDLSTAGIDGVELVAVGDATPALKAVANTVVERPAYHGVLEFLDEVLFPRYDISDKQH
ncbi:MAG: HAD hydrolase family protein [Candidatus Kerfeldbacteria bacterium]